MTHLVMKSLKASVERDKVIEGLQTKIIVSRLQLIFHVLNGHLHVENFLDWLLEVENLFDYMQFPKTRQVKSMTSYRRVHQPGRNKCKITRGVKASNQYVHGQR